MNSIAVLVKSRTLTILLVTLCIQAFALSLTLRSQGRAPQTEILRTPVHAAAMRAVEQSVAPLGAPQSEIVQPEVPALAAAVVAQPPVAAPAKARPKIIKHLVTSGDTLLKIWQKYGGSYASGLAVAEAFKSADISLNAIRVGTEVNLVQSPEGELIGLRLNLDQGKKLIISKDDQQNFKPEVKASRVVETERTVSGIITNSFADAVATLGVPYDVVDNVVDLLGDRIEFTKDLHRGDTFTLIYTDRSVRGTKAQLDVGPIQAASLRLQGKTFATMRHVGQDGKARYYDEKGNPVGNYFLRYPLQFTRISSVFSTARFHPILQQFRPHNGIDFAAPMGTPVRAVGDGVVESAGFNREGGLMVHIRHNDRYTTAYLHLSKIDPSIRTGARVARGQLLGAVGMSGLATGPHLHFSLFDNGHYVDPLHANLPSIPMDGERIPEPLLYAMLEKLDAYNNMLAFDVEKLLSKKAA